MHCKLFGVVIDKVYCVDFELQIVFFLDYIHKLSLSLV
jgi:hypothetical protein